jgi:fucose 4-O-acetylase-like acetyltransferase
VDFLRVLAIGMVVVGHWLVTSPVYRAGSFQASDVLGTIRWGQWVTLLFQVMPVFFLVGGYAAAISWSGHRGRADDAGSWLRARAVRLLIPTAFYAALALVAATVGIALGAPRTTLALAGWAIALQLWFLPVYLVLTALTPLLYEAHRRWGLAVPAVMAAVGVAVDFTVIYAGVKPLGWLNYFLIWGAVYQMGFAWQDGTLTRDRRILPALAAGGALLFAGLVTLGPFPPSLIGVAGERVNNTAPPSAALAAYMAVQISLVVAVAPAVRRWLRRVGPWRVVSRCNKAVMAVYLWHMVPAVVGGLLLYPTGIMPQPTVGSAEWWALRPAWVAVLGALLVLLFYAIGTLARIVQNFNRARRRPRLRAEEAAKDHAERAAATASRLSRVPLWVGIALCGYALYRFAVFGFAPAGTFPLLAALCYAAGLALVCFPEMTKRRSHDLPTGSYTDQTMA